MYLKKSHVATGQVLQSISGQVDLLITEVMAGNDGSEMKVGKIVTWEERGLRPLNFVKSFLANDEVKIFFNDINIAIGKVTKPTVEDTGKVDISITSTYEKNIFTSQLETHFCGGFSPMGY